MPISDTVVDDSEGVPIFDRVTSVPLSEKLGLLKSEYPELKDVPDDHLISQLGRFYPATLADPEFRTAYKRVVGQQAIASETPTEFLRSDRADFGDGPLGNVLTYLAPGGRAIVRGAAQMIDSGVEAQKAIAAAPRVYLGANPITIGIERGISGPALDQLQELVKPAADAPLASAQGLKEAWQGGNTPAYLLERGLEQVPQIAASMGTGAGVGATGMAETIASLSPRIAKMGPEAISALIGTAITTFPQEMGGAYSEMKDQGVEAPATAAAIGAINTFLEFGGDAKVVERALGGDRLAASTIREAVRKGVGRAVGQGFKEAGVETTQELTTAELPVLTGQTKQMPGSDLAWRLGEAAAGGFLPGVVGAGGVDVASAIEGGVISPPVIPPQVTKDQDFAVQVGTLREAARAQRIQQDADDLLAQQMATARLESARQQSLIQQAGGSVIAENAVKVQEALAHADALLQNLSAKRQSQTADIPEVQSGIPLDPTSTTLRIAAEAQRRAEMTPQQRAALEMLDRPTEPDVIPVNRLSPTPEQFDAALKSGVPPVQVEPTLQAQRQLGGRIAAVPDTTTAGLAETGPTTVAPSPVDMLLAEDRGAMYPVPSRSAFARGLKRGMPPVRRTAGPVSTDSGLSESQTSEGTTPVDQYVANPPLRVAPQLATDSGLTDSVSGEASTPVDQFVGDPGNRAKPAPVTPPPASRTAKATEARRQRSALRRQESRGSRVAEAQQPTTKRQRGEMSAIPPRYAAMMERLNTIPQEEKDRASGVSAEAPTTDEGWAMREILHAPQNVELFLSMPENRGNSNVAAYIERRYVERVLDMLSDPKRRAPLGPSLLKNRNKFFAQAISSVRKDLAEVGQSGGQSEVPTEIETESGTITSPEVETAPRAGEEGWFSRSPAAHNARELINEFVANETRTDAEERAALNLMARALGVPDVHTERDPDRTLAEESPALKAKVAEFVADELRAKIIKAHLAGEERVPIGIAAVKTAAAEVTTSPRVKVISDPNLKDENGTPIAGYLSEDGTVVLNSAFIDSPQMAREVLLEELMHAVYGDADVQQAWQAVKDSVTDTELQAMRDAGYSEDVALEEAAIRKVIGQLNNRNAENAVMKFLRAVVNAIRLAFGVSGQDAYATILSRALEAVGPNGQARTSLAQSNPSAELDRQYMAAVQSGDTTAAQRIVDEAAKRSGYTVGPVYHGTPSNITEFRGSRGGNDDFGRGIYFTTDRSVAQSYAEFRGGQNVVAAYLKLRNPAKASDIVPASLARSAAAIASERDAASMEAWRGNPEGGPRPAVFGVDDILASAGRTFGDVLSSTDEAKVWQEAMILAGYDGVTGEDQEGQVVVFTPTQIKSADPIVRDDAGNIVPLSQRFNPDRRDIRFSLRPKLTRQQLVNAAMSSSDWKDFYSRHQALLEEVFGSDADLFQKLLSATSQAASVATNVALALKAYAQLKRGEEFDGRLRGEQSPGYLPAVIQNLNRIKAEDEVQGQKIRAYTAANEGAEESVVVDRHIARMLFGAISPTKAQFAKASGILTEVARMLGWSPREVQAALWAASIRKSGKNPESYDSYINRLRASGDLAKRIGSVVPAGANVGGSNSEAGSGRGSGNAAGIHRTSLTEGRWKSPADLNTDVANAGDPATLKSAAAVQGSLIPDATVQRIDALVNKPAPTKAERIAIRILKPLINVRELASSIWGPGSGFSGYAIGGSIGLSTAVPAAQDIAAESVIRQSIDDRARLEKVTERAEAAANVAAVAMSKLPQAAMHQNDAMLYDSMAKQLARDYQDTLAARIQTAKGANDTLLVQALAQASRNLTQSMRGIGNAVAMALKNIAAEIPDAALASHAATEAWIQARVNNPTLPRIMSVAAQDWLFNPPNGKTVAPIQWDQKLNERLKVMKDLAASNSTLLAQIKAFNASITGGKAPSVRQVFDKYLAFRNSQRDAIEKMQLIFRAVKNAEAELQGSELAQRELEAMVRDPDYQARVTEAARHLNASTRGVRVYERAGNQMTGRLIYLNPLNGAQVAIDTTPDLTTEQENLRKIQALTRDVQTWMGATDDVLLREAWEKEMHYLMDFGFHQAPGLITGTNMGGIRGWSIWQLNPISRHVWRGRLDTRSNLARRVGERLMVPFQMAGIAFDHVQKGLENLVNGRDSEQAVDESTIKALKSHGMKPTQQNVFKWWVTNVVERIISQNQNPTQIPYRVGDWVRGVKITAEDMAAAEQQKRHQFAVHSLLQRNEKDSRNSELWRNPVTTEEEVPGGRHLVRRSTDYGLKMARTLRDWAVEFAEQWVKSDATAKPGLLDQNFQDVVMGVVTETNREMETAIDETDRELFRKLSAMERSNTLPFSDATGFFDWMAGERSALLGTPVAQERVETEARFTGYVDQMANAVVQATKGQANITAEDFLKSGMPKALVQAVAGKDNPFTTARGRMIAPSTWYSYSMTGAGDRAKYRAGALAVLTLREIEAGQMALAAIEAELKKYEGPTGLIAQEQARTPSQSDIRVRMRVAAQSQKLARMGRLMVDYKSLLDHRATLDYMLKDMARLAAEHVTIPEDVAASAFLNSARQSFVGQMLSSARAIATNLFGAGYALSQFRRMIGSYRFMVAPASYIWELSKDLTAIALKSLRKLKGADATGRLLDQIPGVHQIIRAFVNNQLRYEQERMRAESAMVVDPSDWQTTARLAGQLKTTGGRLSEGDKNNPLMASVNVVSGLPVVRYLLALMKSKFPGGIDRLANTITSTKVRQWVNEISGPAFAAWQRRDTGVPGWNDLTNYATSHFGHDELGLVDATTLKFWRDLLRPAGGMERLALDFYERTKGMSAEQRAKEPFLNPEQEDAVVLEAAKLINLPTPTTTHTISQGKGLSGTFRKWLGLFSRYPINANGVNELINSTVPGESPRSAWKLGAAAASIALLILLGSLGSDLGQYGDEIIRGEPRSRPTLAQTVETGDATDWAKYMGLSMAGIYPFWAEMISRAFGGTSNRPMMDATRMFVPFGIAADLESTAMRMFQTGDVRYPMEDFIRRYSPAAGAAINLMDPGDLASRSAARSIRVAAPSDMEIRQSGGAVGNRETPTTPLIRKAANALMVGDESTYQDAVNQAVQLKVDAGATPQAARQSIENQIASRDPAHRIFGRPITPQEEQALLGRMSPVQAQAFQASRSAFARFRNGGRSRSRGSSLRARGGGFGRQRKAFGKRRSAFRVR